MAGISAQEGAELLVARGAELYDLLARAGRLRIELRGDQAATCSVVNVKSGHCGQDCAFCSQSSRSEARIERYGLLGADEIVERARAAAEAGAHRVGIVTSGKAVCRPEELETIAEAVAAIATDLPALACASLGLVDEQSLGRLRQAGLSRYHHNLETAESFWPRVCTTRPWRESVATVEAARAAGLEVCCGGIFGLGESLAQRVELLEAIARLEVGSVPLNFLHPIAGTPLEQIEPLRPVECLKVIAVARLMMPDREIRVCGGREHNLRDLQSWVAMAGADGIMIGGYLTTTGRRVADDLQMLADLGLSPAAPPRRGGDR